MLTVRKIEPNERKLIDRVVTIHLLAFNGFFLSSLNRGFLRCLYKSICEYDSADLLVAFDGEKPVGFLAYGKNISGLYSYMIEKHLIAFAWYSFLAFLRRPSILPKMLRALTMPSQTKRHTHTVKVSSIGVDPEYRKHGVGTLMLNEMKREINFNEINYVTLETDAVDNDKTIEFYVKNGFRFSYQFVTPENRKMNVYHYRKKT